MKKVLIVGSGNMGEAMLRGWVKASNELTKIYVREPNPSNWLKRMNDKKKITLNPLDIKGQINVCIFAVKPQVAEQVIKDNKNDLADNSFIISVIAGKDFSFFHNIFKVPCPVIRVMPNTPVSIEQGVSAIIGNEYSSLAHIKWTEHFFSTLGKTVVLEKESMMDVVTAISGSGPAYIFNFAEILIGVGNDLGIPEEITKTIVLQTIIGAGLLAIDSDKSPSKLREDVTSPNGTTQAALNILMDKKNGWHEIIKNAVVAAYNRSKSLAKN